MAVNETIKNGFYRVWDSTTEAWRRLALWTKGEQVECADGNTVEEKIGAINGITNSLASTASDIAASAAAVNTLNKNMGGCTLSQEGNDFYITGADSVRKKLGDVIDLGIGQSFDVTAYAGYENFTIDDFICELSETSKTVSQQGTTGVGSNSAHARAYAYLDFLKTYEKGVLSVYYSLGARPSTANGYAANTKTEKIDAHVYLKL